MKIIKSPRTGIQSEAKCMTENMQHSLTSARSPGILPPNLATLFPNRPAASDPKHKVPLATAKLLGHKGPVNILTCCHVCFRKIRPSIDTTWTINSHLISAHLISSQLISSDLSSAHLISAQLSSSHLTSSHLSSSHLFFFPRTFLAA